MSCIPSKRTLLPHRRICQSNDTLNLSMIIAIKIKYMFVNSMNNSKFELNWDKICFSQGIMIPNIPIYTT